LQHKSTCFLATFQLLLIMAIHSLDEGMQSCQHLIDHDLKSCCIVQFKKCGLNTRALRLRWMQIAAEKALPAELCQHPSDTASAWRCFACWRYPVCRGWARLWRGAFSHPHRASFPPVFLNYGSHWRLLGLPAMPAPTCLFSPCWSALPGYPWPAVLDCYWLTDFDF